MLALRTSVRCGELLGLRWSDMDLTGGTLAIRQPLQYIPGGTGLVLAPTKTVNSERRITCPAPASSPWPNTASVKNANARPSARPGRRPGSCSPPATAA